MEKFDVYRRDNRVFIGTFEAPSGKVQEVMKEVIDHDPDLTPGTCTHSYIVYHLGNATLFDASFKNERFRGGVKRLTNPDSNLDPTDDTPVT